MNMQREESLQIWLGWLLGTTAGALISSLFFGFPTLEAFLICALIGYLFSKWLTKKNEPRPILV